MAKDKICTPFLALASPENKFTANTIEDMQSRKYLKIGDVVELNGYYTAGDGAGHKRKIEEADDGSGVQLANGLWANIVHSGEVNVSWFGAKGDGVTDDTQKIISAITFSSNENISCLFDQKLYGMTTTVIEVKNVNIRGASVIKRLDNSVTTNWATLFRFNGTKFTDYIIIDGLTFLGNSVNNPLIPSDNIYAFEQSSTIRVQLDAVKSKVVNIVEIKNCTFVDCIADSLTLGAGGSDNVYVETIRVSNCKFKDRNRTRSSILLGGYFVRSFINDCEGVDADGAVYLSRIETEFVQQANIKKDVFINNCNFAKFEAGGIIVEGKVETTFYITDSHFEKQFLSNRVNTIVSNSFFTFSTTTSCKSGLLRIKNCHVKFEKSLKVVPDSSVRAEVVIEDSILEESPDAILSLGLIDLSRNSDATASTKLTISGSTFMTKNATCIYGYNCEVYSTNNKYAGKLGVFTGFSEGFASKFKTYGDDYTACTEYPFNLNNAGSDLTNSYVDVFGGHYKDQNIQIAYANGGNIPITSFRQITVKNFTGTGSGLKNDIVYSDNGAYINKQTSRSSMNVWHKIIDYNLDVTNLNTPYHTAKMQEEGVYNDFIQYMDEKTEYDRLQRELEQQRQLAFEQRENQEKVYEEWLAEQPMMLPVVEEPQPSEKLLAFKTKYLG